MPLIQDPTPVRKLQRGLRLTGLPDGVLAPEIVGVILLEDFSAPLSDVERGCRGSASAGAVAAENPLVALVRVGAPATYDLVVTEIFFTSETTQVVFVRVPTAGIVGLAVSGNSSFTDFELPGRPTSQLGTDTQVGVPAGRNLWEGRVIANTQVSLKTEIRIGTIGQGSNLTSLMIAGVTVNTILRGGFKWTESSPQG